LSKTNLSPAKTINMVKKRCNYLNTENKSI
jgi:hypothetical protein